MKQEAVEQAIERLGVTGDLAEQVRALLTGAHHHPSGGSPLSRETTSETFVPQDNVVDDPSDLAFEFIDPQTPTITDEVDPMNTFAGLDNEEIDDLFGPPTDEVARHTLPDSPTSSRPPSIPPEGVGGRTDPDQNRLGRYVDLGLLGIGGMGEVRKVRDDILRRTLAMKIIHQKLLNHRGAVSRFIEEAQVGAQLQHPNIIPVYELGKLQSGRHYFTMKEILGTEFTEHIKGVHEASDDERWRAARGGITFRHLIQTFHKLCVTMAYAHSKGVIHRDLKPENIMIGGFGEVLVVDWGIAKVMGRDQADDWEYAVETDRSIDNIMATRMGSIAGTPCYMSPEQAQGLTEQIGFASDIYTLGAILYEILSGHPPFLGDTPDEVIERVRSETPPPLRRSTWRNSGEPPGGVPNHEALTPLPETSNKLPEPLIAICERAMAREMSARFARALRRWRTRSWVGLRGRRSGTRA